MPRVFPNRAQSSTRIAHPEAGPKYGGLKLVSMLSKGIGILVILLGILVMVAGFISPV